MIDIFLDESGYTGANWVDDQAPFFVLATSNLTELESRELKNRFFSNVKATELKHTALQRTSKQQRMVLNFLDHVSANNTKNVKICSADKKFALIAKYVDTFIEPVFHEQEENLYQDAQSYALASLLYGTIESFFGKVFFENFLSYFQTFMRNKNLQNLRNLHDLIQSQQIASKNLPESHRNIIALLYLGFSYFRERIFSVVQGMELDLGVTTTLKLMGMWQFDLNTSITLLHDQSTAMAKQKSLWDFLTSDSRSLQSYTEPHVSVKFPIDIRKTQFESSEKYAGLQITDVLAGATARGFRWLLRQDNDSYGEAIARGFLNDFPKNPNSSYFVVAATDFERLAKQYKGHNRGQVTEFLTEEFKDFNG